MDNFTMLLFSEPVFPEFEPLLWFATVCCPHTDSCRSNRMPCRMDHSAAAGSPKSVSGCCSSNLLKKYGTNMVSNFHYLWNVWEARLFTCSMSRLADGQTEKKYKRNKETKDEKKTWFSDISEVQKEEEKTKEISLRKRLTTQKEQIF